MKVIIAGGRGFDDYQRLYSIMDSLHNSYPITEVVCGCAKGADSIGAQWSINRNIPIKRFPANWDEFGKSVGHIRNKEMAEYTDRAVVFWDGKSRGSRSMIGTMKKLNKKVKVVKYE